MKKEPEDLRTREPEDPLADLRSELQSVKPSPAFAAGVRERIEIEKDRRARGSWWFDWRTLVTTGSAIAVVAFIVYSQLRQGGPVGISPSDRPAPFAKVSRPVITEAGPRLDPSERSNDRVNARPNPRVEGGVSQLNAMRIAQEPPLEVITTQPAILRALWERYREAELALAAAQSVPTDVRDVVVVPVEVEPVVVKWLVEPPVVPGSVPIIRRLTAETAERSAK